MTVTGYTLETRYTYLLGIYYQIIFEFITYNNNLEIERNIKNWKIHINYVFYRHRDRNRHLY